MSKLELTIVENDYNPTDEQIRDHWAGEGHIEFFVEQNVPGVFEIEILDYSGCAGGMGETIGLEYAIHHELLQDRSRLREGVTYTINRLTADFTRGDGWTTDDDVSWDFQELTYKIEPWRYLKQKLANIWWRQVVCRLSERNQK